MPSIKLHFSLFPNSGSTMLTDCNPIIILFYRWNIPKSSSPQIHRAHSTQYSFQYFALWPHMRLSKPHRIGCGSRAFLTSSPEHPKIKRTKPSMRSNLSVCPVVVVHQRNEVACLTVVLTCGGVKK